MLFERDWDAAAVQRMVMRILKTKLRRDERKSEDPFHQEDEADQREDLKGFISSSQRTTVCSVYNKMWKVAPNVVLKQHLMSCTA